MEAWKIILLALLGSGILFWISSYFIIAAVVYRILLVRTRPEKWSRECSLDEEEEQTRMYAEGNAWYERYRDRISDVSIVSDGFRLFGEYVDFGFDRAVIIIAGRTEGCKYSYYFAEPYRAAGYNVLVIDNRCHGLSDGKYVSLGLKEYKDVLRWGEMLHDNLRNEKIVIHGICIGSATALYALISSECPDYFAGMVADGMYADFRESIKNHMIEQKRKNIGICLSIKPLNQNRRRDPSSAFIIISIPAS
jgi:pimeloyl-ACP methyl ester carboxylesterase